MQISLILLLGLLQGALEWIPVSSEGIISLILIYLGYSLREAVRYSLWLHSGTLLASMIYFRKDLSAMLKSVFNSESKELLSFIVTSTMISAIIGGLIYFYGLSKLLVDWRSSSALIGLFLTLTGLYQRFSRVNGFKSRVEFLDGLIAGAVQAFSIIPGLSRSGLTITTLLMRGFNLERSLKLSYLMSIPVTAIAVTSMVFLKELNMDVYGVIAATLSLIVGFSTIKGLMSIAVKYSFWKTCLILGLIVICSSLIPL